MSLLVLASSSRVCVGEELVIARRVTSSISVPASLRDKKRVRGPDPKMAARGLVPAAGTGRVRKPLATGNECGKSVLKIGSTTYAASVRLQVAERMHGIVDSCHSYFGTAVLFGVVHTGIRSQSVPGIWTAATPRDRPTAVSRERKHAEVTSFFESVWTEHFTGQIRAHQNRRWVARVRILVNKRWARLDRQTTIHMRLKKQCAAMSRHEKSSLP